MKCGQCSSAYCRRNNGSGKYHHFIWTCRRYDELGKAVCPAQAVPEEILIEKTKEVLGADALTRDLLLAELKEITVPGRGRLIYHFKNGETKEIEWQHHSRHAASGAGAWNKTTPKGGRQLNTNLAPNVKLIQPVKKLIEQELNFEPTKLRVAAYARVSTEQDE